MRVPIFKNDTKIPDNKRKHDEVSNEEENEDECPPEYRELYGPGFDYERYMEEDEKEYRLSIGPSIPLWGDCGSIESLVGLSFEWTFKLPNKEKSTAKARVGMTKDNGWHDKTRNVYWTFDDNSHEEFLLPMEEHDILECYFMTRPKEEIPSWFDYKHKFASPLFDVPPSVTLSNFKLPDHAVESFDCVKEEEDNDWWITLACLNDPDNESHYDPSGNICYPLSYLLTLIVLCKRFDPSTALPTMRKDTAEARKVQKLVDKYSGMISSYGSATGQLLRICKDLKQKSTTYANKKHPTLKQTKEALIVVEAIILTMSMQYEGFSDNWYLTDDVKSVYQCAYELVMGIGRVLLHEKATDGIKSLGNGNMIATHLKEGSFRQFLVEVDLKEWFEDTQKVLKTWTDVLKFAEGLKEEDKDE